MEEMGGPTLSQEEQEQLALRYPLKEGHVLNCMFDRWYPTFRKHTFKSRIVPLEEDFISYLLDDGTIYLPSSAYKERKRDIDEYGVNEWHEEDAAIQRRREAAARLRREGSLFAVSDSEEEKEEYTDEPTCAEFPELEEEVMSIIEEFGGAALPKMNWSSPKDAYWVNTGSTLKCTSFGDVCLLLKSSDFVSHDLCYAFSGSVDNEGKPSQLKRPPQFNLVLRKWFTLTPALEFRCFIKNRTLIGISQRDPAKFYPFLPKIKTDLRNMIEDFLNRHVIHAFPDDNVVADVYVEESTNRVWLMDFNPFGPVTDGLLFSWAEIYSVPIPREATGTELARHEREGGGLVDFRIVESEAEVRVSTAGSSRYPVDMTRGMFDADTATDINNLIDMMQSGKLV